MLNNPVFINSLTVISQMKTWIFHYSICDVFICLDVSEVYTLNPLNHMYELLLLINATHGVKGRFYQVEVTG